MLDSNRKTAVWLIVASLFYSTFVTLRDGGVRWRETFYSLAQLRAANRTR